MCCTCFMSYSFLSTFFIMWKGEKYTLRISRVNSLYLWGEVSHCNPSVYPFFSFSLRNVLSLLKRENMDNRCVVLVIKMWLWWCQILGGLKDDNSVSKMTFYVDRSFKSSWWHLSKRELIATNRWFLMMASKNIYQA